MDPPVHHLTQLGRKGWRVTQKGPWTKGNLNEGNLQEDIEYDQGLNDRLKKLTFAGSQDSIRFMQMFSVILKAPHKMSFSPFSLLVPWVESHSTTHSSPTRPCGFIHTFLSLPGLCSLLGMLITPLGPVGAMNPTRSSTNGTFSVKMSLPLGNHSTCDIILQLSDCLSRLYVSRGQGCVHAG